MRTRHLVVCLAIVLSAAFVQAQSTGHQGHQSHIFLTPADLKWEPAPPGLPPGAQGAILSGDPSKPEPFSLAVKFPDGYTIAAHWHPVIENVIVVQGTLMMGVGDKFDEKSLKSLGAGSYSMLPAKTNHFVRTKGATTIVVYSTGPFEITYVNPKDDPRIKK